MNMNPCLRNQIPLMILVLKMCIFIFLPAFPSAVAGIFPKPTGAVNDFAGVIPPATAGQMEQRAREVLEKTGTALVVATIETIGDIDLDDYANRLYQTWGIGKKGEDKGVLIFLALKERKVRIETGYGVQGIIPDGLAGEILDRYAVPHFRKGDYGRGLAAAMAEVAAVVARAAGVTLTKEREIVIEGVSREVVFSMTKCDGSYRAVRGDIPDEVDLSNDTMARQILEKAAHFAQEKCPDKRHFGNIDVYLCKTGEKGFGCSVRARNYDNSRLTWFEYNNRALENRVAQERERKRIEQERVTKIETEERKIEEEKRRVETEARVARRLEEEKRRVEAEVNRVKNIPVYVRNLVFRDSKFVWPVTTIIPRDDEPRLADKIKRVEREADAYSKYKITSWNLNIKEFRNKNLLDFLVKHGYVRVEAFNLHIKRYNRNQEFKLFYYNDKLNMHILRQSPMREFPPNSSEIVCAVRKLKSIDYINEYERTVPARIKVYALTFTYFLEEKLPGLSRINRTFQGKATVYLDPNDGRWKLENLNLEDNGANEYLKLMDR